VRETLESELLYPRKVATNLGSGTKKRSVKRRKGARLRKTGESDRGLGGKGRIRGNQNENGRMTGTKWREGTGRAPASKLAEQLSGTRCSRSGQDESDQVGEVAFASAIDCAPKPRTRKKKRLNQSRGGFVGPLYTKTKENHVALGRPRSCRRLATEDRSGEA